MNNTTNYRIFVEKLPRFRVEAESLRRELNTNLNLSLGEVRLLCVYDLFGFSEELLEKSRYTVFGEVVTDSVTDTFDLAGRKYIAVEYLPGQFDQRAASAVDCVRLIDPEARVDIRSSRLLVFDDKTTDGELAKIRHYYINAVESREKDLSVLSDMEQAEVKPVGALEGFREMADSELEPYCKTMGLAMNADDLREVVKYFRSEGRDPYETELRILDTYWSDHCRHTTFTTELEGITVEESFVKEEIEDSLALYLRIRRELGREHKSLCLMDMATIGARYLRQKGLLDDLEVSEENNACSVYIDVDVDRAGVVLLRDLQIVQQAFLPEVARADGRHIHQAEALVLTPQFAADTQVQRQRIFDLLLDERLLDGDALQLGREGRVAAVVAPVSVEDAQLGFVGIAPLRTEVFHHLAQVVGVHRQTHRLAVRLQFGIRHLPEPFERPDGLHFGLLHVAEHRKVLLTRFDGVDVVMPDLRQLPVGRLVIENEQPRRADVDPGLGIDQPHAVDGRSGALVELPGQILHGDILAPREVERVGHRVGHHLAENRIAALFQQLFAEAEKVVDAEQAHLAQRQVQIGVQLAAQALGLDPEAG